MPDHLPIWHPSVWQGNSQGDICHLLYSTIQMGYAKNDVPNWETDDQPMARTWQIIYFQINPHEIDILTLDALNLTLTKINENVDGNGKIPFLWTHGPSCSQPSTGARGLGIKIVWKLGWNDQNLRCPNRSYSPLDKVYLQQGVFSKLGYIVYHDWFPDWMYPTTNTQWMNGKTLPWNFHFNLMNIFNVFNKHWMHKKTSKTWTIWTKNVAWSGDQEGFGRSGCGGANQIDAIPKWTDQ